MTMIVERLHRGARNCAASAKMAVLITAAIALAGCGEMRGGSRNSGPGGEPAADAVNWQQDFEKAKSMAAEQGKPILADFTGSDWCGWCKRLDAEVFSRQAFADFAGEAVIPFKADFPQFKRLPEAVRAQNEALAKQYGIQGFPTILLLNADGSVIGATGYQPGGAEAYVEHLEKIIAGQKTG